MKLWYWSNGVDAVTSPHNMKSVSESVKEIRQYHVDNQNGPWFNFHFHILKLGRPARKHFGKTSVQLLDNYAELLEIPSDGTEYDRILNLSKFRGCTIVLDPANGKYDIASRRLEHAKNISPHLKGKSEQFNTILLHLY